MDTKEEAFKATKESILLQPPQPLMACTFQYKSEFQYVKWAPKIHWYGSLSDLNKMHALKLNSKHKTWTEMAQ